MKNSSKSKEVGRLVVGRLISEGQAFVSPVHSVTCVKNRYGNNDLPAVAKSPARDSAFENFFVCSKISFFLERKRERVRKVGKKGKVNAALGTVESCLKHLLPFLGSEQTCLNWAWHQQTGKVPNSKTSLYFFSLSLERRTILQRWI